MLYGMITIILGALLGIHGLLIGFFVHFIGIQYEKNNYKPVSEILYGFSDEKKELLCSKIKKILKRSTFTDTSQLLKSSKSDNNYYYDIRDKMIAFLALEYNLISKPKPNNK
ncbi:uncharacterized protein LOC106870773 [Octopus bimaculoides]|uniref:Uncharacterized protein n=1 Tax=Octopus bimaculoides TaxID=37653 RepID=A0A0L8HGM3_OCTBM|nr:uncharacterized protein LOC106870773 [Octopus bimaculoides]|eukprot:XP_014772457.1 PREDICTED: uncharacterized protein LOC106870773 [Octopus bimaculoides]